jgi:hypothetical protein
MKLRAISLSGVAFAAATLALPQGASASLIYDASIHAPAQGFGNAPRDLSLQATGQATFESGAVDYTGSGIDFGTPIADSLVHGGNGVTNQSGTSTMPNPRPTTRSTGFRRSVPSGLPMPVRSRCCSMPPSLAAMPLTSST